MNANCLSKAGRQPQRIATIFAVVATLLGIAATAYAQGTVGEVLAKGGKRLTKEEFTSELVQRTLVGASSFGGIFAISATHGQDMEVLYGTRGVLSGFIGTRGSFNGKWEFDGDGNVCDERSVVGNQQTITVPRRCQMWFKLGTQYFVADTTWEDRSARVAPFALKVAAPRTLSTQPTVRELLDAGARKLTTKEFMEEVAQRTLTGPAPKPNVTITGTAGRDVVEGEFLYAANGQVVARVGVTGSGEWRAEAPDKVCVRLQWLERLVEPWRCSLWYRLGGTYYVVLSDQEAPSAIAYARAVK